MIEQSTKRPWSINNDYDNRIMQGNQLIAECWSNEPLLTWDNAVSNARLIVKAVNNYDQLVEALKAVSKCNRGEGLPVDVVIKMMETLDKAGEA